MTPLMDQDIEVDFFANMVHIQVRIMSIELIFKKYIFMSTQLLICFETQSSFLFMK